jgi:hypothetical protein
MQEECCAYPRLRVPGGGSCLNLICNLLSEKAPFPHGAGGSFFVA